MKQPTFDLLALRQRRVRVDAWAGSTPEVGDQLRARRVRRQNSPRSPPPAAPDVVPHASTQSEYRGGRLRRSSGTR